MQLTKINETDENQDILALLTQEERDQLNELLMKDNESLAPLTKVDISIDIKEITEYTRTRETTIIDFEEKVNTYAILKRWSEEQKVMIASARLSGPAKTTERELKLTNPHNTFMQLCDEVKDKIAGVDYQLQLKEKLRYIRQKDQTVTQLINALDEAFLRDQVLQDEQKKFI